MDQPGRHDAPMKQLFTTSRDVDRQTLPGYRAVRGAAPADAGPRFPSARRLLTLSLATATGGAAVAAIVLFLALPSREASRAWEFGEAPEPFQVAQAPGSSSVLRAQDETAPPDIGEAVAASGELAPGGVESRWSDVRVTPPPPSSPPSAVEVSRALARLERVGAPERQRQAVPEPHVLMADSRTSPPGAGGGYLGMASLQHGVEAPGVESYAYVDERGFVAVADDPLSTFSVDVDTASYANVRRYLSAGRLPPPDAVRIEELINYFDYDYPEPSSGEPLSATVEVAGCPWAPDHRLARIGIRGRRIDRAETKGSNLVFLVDVSGSMEDANKLPLLKSAFKLLAAELTGRDRVAIVFYSSTVGLALSSTSGDDRAAILKAIDSLEASGGTNGDAGLQVAYRIARDGFVPGGVNRVVLATDGDFNAGRNGGDLVRLIREHASAGVALSVLGFGTGNLKDDALEFLADRGDGNYFYIDTEREARKVLVDQLHGTLVTVARDVKIQVEFNPAEVAAYRLIGYENRALARQDFNDDGKDAGDIGSGHTVTALYELVPADVRQQQGAVDPLRYQRLQGRSAAADSGELLTVKVRYKEAAAAGEPVADAAGSPSRLLQVVAHDAGSSFRRASDDFRFAASVAAFGMVLRDSEHRGSADLAAVAEILTQGTGTDTSVYRAEFVNLVQQARTAQR